MSNRVPPSSEDFAALLHRVDIRLTLEIALVVFVPLIAVLLIGPTLWAGVIAGIVGVGYALYRARQTQTHERALAASGSLLQTQAERLSRLEHARHDMILAIDRGEVADVILRSMIEFVRADAAALYLADAERRMLTLVKVSRIAETRLAEKMPASALDGVDTDIRVYAAANADARFQELGAAPAFAAVAEIAIRSNSSLLGVLRLYFHAQPTLSEGDCQQVQQMARFTATALDNLEMFTIMESYANDMAQLAHLSRISGSSLSIGDILTNMSRILKQMVNAKDVTLAIIRTNGSAVPLLDLYSERAPVDTLTLDTVPELALMRQQERPRATQFSLEAPELSTGMQDLIRIHGTQLTVFPLISYVDLLGLILIGDSELGGLSDNRWQLLEMASNQVASQVLNTRVHALTHQELDERLAQLNILSVVAQQISAALDPDTILATMLEMAVRATSANAGTVALLQEGEDTWKIIQYNDSGILQRSQRTRQGDEGVLGQVVRSRETLLIRDTREMVYGFAAPSPTSYLSAVAVPLISDGKVIGVLHMESLRTDFFAGEQVGFLDNLARHAVISIENARLLEERQHQIMTLRHLQGLSLRLSSVTETSYVAQEVVRTALDLLHGRKGALFRLSADDEQRRLELLADVSEDADTVSASQLFRNSAGATRAAQTGEIQILHEMRPISDGDPVRLYAISVPIKRGERVREILCIGFEGQRTFSKRELESISLLATQAAGHLENATLHEYIRARNDRMRAILNSTRDGVILLDKQGRLVETNPAARRLLGVDLDERLGENLVDVLLQFASGDVFERAGYTREEVTALARQLRLEPQLISRREFSRSMPGQMLYIEEIGSPVMGSDGQIVGRLLVLRDITKQKQLDEYREEITHMAVHDLRGPLASIISSLHFALDEPAMLNDVATTRKTLGLSLDSANNLMHLIESLLDISRLEKREMPLRRAPTRAADLVDAVETTLSSSIHEAAVTIQRDLPDGLPLLNVDPDIVRRVLINLVDNALRFTPSGSTILIQALECPDTVLLRVADSGPGIPEEDREHVFERFRQVKNNLPARGTRGSGLGLTFCRLAVEAHGGRIWVERESPLPGASIAVLLPSTPAPDS